MSIRVDTRWSKSSGEKLYRIKKPGFQHDLFITQAEALELVAMITASEDAPDDNDN